MIEYKKKINERLKFIVQSEFIKPLFPQQFEQYGKTRIKSAKKTGFLQNFYERNFSRLCDLGHRVKYELFYKSGAENLPDIGHYQTYPDLDTSYTVLSRY